MKFNLSVLGDIEKDMRQRAADFERAGQGAMKKVGFNIRKEWQNQIRRAGLGNKLPRTIRYKFYKNKGYDPAVVVYTKASDIIRAFAQGVTIRARRTKYLAIPTKFAPKRGTGGGRGSLAPRIRPENFPEHRLGKLRFVPARGSRPALLVVNNVRKSYSKKDGRLRGVTKASSRARTRGEAEALAMFILVPQVTLRRRLNVESIVERWHRQVPDIIDENIRKDKARRAGE